MLDRAAYEALQALNWSRLKLIERSPAHFKYGFGDNDEAHFRLGTAAHMATLEPERFKTHAVVYPGRRDKRATAWQEFEAEHLEKGHLILIESEHAEALAIANAVHSHPKAHSYVVGGEAEVATVWKIAAGALQFDCKGRMDYVGPALVDLKSTKDASPRAFASSCARYGYFGQAAWYSDGHFLATGQRLPFIFIAIEKTPPYVVQVYRVPESVLERGRDQYLTLLGKLDYCQRRNWWGGYSEQDEIDLEMPSWAEVA